MFRLTILGLVLWMLAMASGCSFERRAGDLARISPGDPKWMVLQNMGTPSAAESKDHNETLYYELLDKEGATERYYVHLVGGAVDSYGKAEDRANSPCK